MKMMIKPTEQEETFYYCMIGTGGGFMTKLYAAIMHADIVNRFRLAQGFPTEVMIASRYQEEKGYWEELCDKMKKSE